MNRYVATFHTHLSAMLTCRALTDAGLEARMAPVPRSISSSCGTCVRFECGEDTEIHSDDLEQLFRLDGEELTMICSNR